MKVCSNFQVLCVRNGTHLGLGISRRAQLRISSSVGHMKIGHEGMLARDMVMAVFLEVLDWPSSDYTDQTRPQRSEKENLAGGHSTLGGT